MQLTGSCLCGKTKYKVKVDNTDGYYCHCRMCQLAFGNTHASFLNVKQKNLSWTKSKPKKYKSSKFATRQFCGTCGTPFTFAFNDSENIDISVGSLDHPEKIKPKSHFAPESAVKPWFPKDKLKKISLKTHKALAARWDKFYKGKKPGVDTVRKA